MIDDCTTRWHPDERERRKAAWDEAVKRDERALRSIEEIIDSIPAREKEALMRAIDRNVPRTLKTMDLFRGAELRSVFDASPEGLESWDEWQDARNRISHMQTGLAYLYGLHVGAAGARGRKPRTFRPKHR